MTRFRLAAAADIDVYASWFSDGELARRLSPPTPDWRAYIAQPGNAFWVGLDADGGGIIAAFQTEFEDGSGGRVSFDCAINPRLRGQGLMGPVFRDFLSGPLAGESVIVAEAELSNVASLRLLRSAGFVEAPEGQTDGFLRFELVR